MSARFLGTIAGHSAPVPGGASPAHGELAAQALAGGGFIAHHPRLSVARDGDDLCLALGEPRFQDASLADLAGRQGAAAAWIAAVREREDAAPTRVRGRFAAVVVRAGGREAWMAVDRFGTWPVCYAESAGRLHFADRADAVPGGSRGLSPQGLFDYLYFHMIPAPATVFEGVNRLPAGHLLKWADGRLECVRYWQPRFDERARPDLEASKRRFRELVEEAVAREAAGHRAGTFLSGGTDSSTVCGMLCKVLGEPAKAYSIGFDASGYDEMEYARIAAKHFGAEHHEHYVTPDDLLDGIPQVAVHYDQPFGNSSAVPAWICASRARSDGIDKLLAGDGGDELFGGNSRYARQRVFGWYEQVPAAVRRGVLEPVLALPAASRIPVVKKGASYVEQARVPMPDRLQMYNMLSRLGMQQIFEADFLARVDTGHPLAMQRETWREADGGALINRMLAWDWKYTLADNDLPKVLGTAGLAGLEVGFPLLSDELLDFSLSLPAEWKLKGLTLRWFFKEALRGFLPDEIIAKKKHGFGLPFGVWACRHDGLRTLARDALGSFARRGIVRPAFIDELLAVHLPAHPGYYGEMVWILMTLEIWLRAHAADRRQEEAASVDA